ncbi:CD225/dispanin family protein [Modestobacter marinus]|uniref:CD225/dispanin family protein n=1 Tax=Modestobacter marinus TaxID=477641 RepID=UPI001C95E01C|nr:CD225/dispanin family protein [Modestobacter marinus]
MTTHTPPPSRNGAAPGAPKFPPPPLPTPPPFAPSYTGVNPMQMGAKQPPNYLALSIVALVCSLLFGAIGLFFSSQVTARWNAGDVEGAQKASNVALIIDVIGIVIGGFLLLAAMGGSGY